MVQKLAADFRLRINKGLRPRTLAAYKQKFRLFLAFVIHLQLPQPDSTQTVTLFLKFMAQQGLRAETLSNYMGVLAHFFALFNWDTSVLQAKELKLAIKAVAYNAPLSFRIKEAFSVQQLKTLVQVFGHHRDSAAVGDERLYCETGQYRLVDAVCF